MTTYTVKQDGTGDYTSITSAVASVNRYDIIEVHDNETYGEGNISRVIADLTIRAGTDASGNKYTPVMSGGGTLDCAIKFYNNWIIEDLTITGYDGTATYGAGLISISSNRVVTIKNCTIHDLADSAIAGLKIGSTVENCIIYNIRGTASRGIDAGVEGVDILNCLIYDVQHDGIQSTGVNSDIQHCTVYNVGFGGGTGGYGISGGAGSVKFCVVSDPNHHLSAAGIRATTHSYNCVSGSEGSSSGNFFGGSGTGDIQTDPMLLSGTFALRPASPCIATAVGSTRAYDITGASVSWQYSHKVNGINTSATPNDMGAYETNYSAVKGVKTDKITKVIGVTD